MLREFAVDAEALAKLKVGETVSVETFAVDQLVDVTGTTKGRGFAGVITRNHFSSNRASHGNSLSHNKPGSISMAQDPGRVFPGKRMAGQYGNVKRTAQALESMLKQFHPKKDYGITIQDDWIEDLERTYKVKL